MLMGISTCKIMLYSYQKLITFSLYDTQLCFLMLVYNNKFESVSEHPPMKDADWTKNKILNYIFEDCEHGNNPELLEQKIIKTAPF